VLLNQTGRIRKYSIRNWQEGGYNSPKQIGYVDLFRGG
jgi:hypothetical protein